jgi:hypothetical protein
MLLYYHLFIIYWFIYLEFVAFPAVIILHSDTQENACHKDIACKHLQIMFRTGLPKISCADTVDATDISLALSILLTISRIHISRVATTWQRHKLGDSVSLCEL